MEEKVLEGTEMETDEAKHYIKAEKGLLVRAFSSPDDRRDIRYKGIGQEAPVQGLELRLLYLTQAHSKTTLG